MAKKTLSALVKPSRLKFVVSDQEVCVEVRPMCVAELRRYASLIIGIGQKVSAKFPAMAAAWSSGGGSDETEIVPVKIVDGSLVPEESAAKSADDSGAPGWSEILAFIVPLFLSDGLQIVDACVDIELDSCPHWMLPLIVVEWVNLSFDGGKAIAAWVDGIAQIMKSVADGTAVAVAAPAA